MAKWNKLVITDAGYQLSAQTLAGIKIQYTHAQTTDKDMSNLTVDQLKAITKLDSVVQDLPVGILNVQNDHTVNVPVKVANNELQTDYLLSGIALFAKPENGTEILYGIVTAVSPDLIPAQSGTTVVGTTFRLKVHVGDASNVNIVISPDGSVTYEELESILIDYVKSKDLANELPTNIMDLDTNQTITAPKNFTTPPTVNGVKVATINDLNSRLGQGGIYYPSLKNGATGILTGTTTPTADAGVEMMSFSGKIRLYLNALTGTDGNSAYIPSNDITDKTYSFITNIDDGFLGVTKYNVHIAALSNVPYPIANQDLAYQRVPAYNDSGSFVGMVVVMVNHGTNDSFGIGLHATTWLSDNITGSGTNFRVLKQLSSGNYTLDFANSIPVKMWN